ncbi:hypothetical protein MRB53_035165 [Persea americana]|uniref:Uncharacterized protein n=1 Tax=Persea americana TaxID=3435 RepID=A0ACC2K4G1_PERAE|nr:hypothetical protein MRB53_035165 [Persea americana]
MKRKKWTEEEESTLIAKYSDLLQSGTLQKLKTRQKKFEPIAHHVNSLHHLHNPISFPFLWSWRDVSIKIQNMRHQYLGVKQKIRIPSSSSSSSSQHFNWSDATNHWQNFLNYKSVFGDIDLDENITVSTNNCNSNNSNTNISNDIAFDADPIFNFVGGDSDDVLGIGLGIEDEEDEELDGNCKDVEEDDDGVREAKRAKREVEWEEREWMWGRREMERRRRVEREFEDGERRRRMRMEERREEEEMEWRERMVGMQMEHEKQMMQMHADACHGQMQVLGLLVRLVCQFFGSGGDGLGGGMGVISSQVLQHPGSLVGDNGKADGNSDPHFM